MIDYRSRPDSDLIQHMGMTMKNRGPDATECYCDETVALHHNRLSVMDPENGRQPMTVAYQGKEYTIVYNGEIYNSPELRRELAPYGAVFKTQCDTETVLWSYIIFKNECPKKTQRHFRLLRIRQNRTDRFYGPRPIGRETIFLYSCGQYLSVRLRNQSAAA